MNSKIGLRGCLLYGVSEDLLPRLQSVQNATSRFITGARKYDHITHVLRDLHWLPLRQRIIFKIATLMYQCLQWFCTSLPGVRLHGNLVNAQSKTVAICHIRTELKQWHLNQGRSRSLVPQSGMICLPDWRTLQQSKNSFRILLKTFFFIADCYLLRICGLFQFARKNVRPSGIADPFQNSFSHTQNSQHRHTILFVLSAEPLQTNSTASFVQLKSPGTTTLQN